MTSPGITVKVAVLGGKGLGSVAAQTVQNLICSGASYMFVGYLNDRLEVGSALYGGRVLCSFDDWSSLDGDITFVAPLHKAGHMQQNATRILGLHIPESRWTRLVEPGAALADNIQIGPGSIISTFASVGPESIIGGHCLVRSGAGIGHDSIVGDFAYVGAKATLCGGCCIGTGAHIAPGAAIRGFLKVGRFSIVGLGAVVTKDVPDYAIVAGNPAQMQGEVARLDVGV